MTENPDPNKSSNASASVKGSLDRRQFIAATGVTAAAVGLHGATLRPAAASQTLPEKEVERTLVGYVDNLSVRPGETVEFKVSSFGGQYEADLVRVINGDAQSCYKDMFKVEPIAAPFAGKYDGEEQPINLGSYVHVKKTGPLDEIQSFTIAALIYPTFDPTEYEPPDLDNIDPFFPPTLNIAASVKSQTIVSRFDKSKGTGWVLRLNEKFQLEFAVGSGNGKLQTVAVSQAARTWDWTSVAASYDASKGVLTVHLRERPYSPGDQFTARKISSAGKLDKVPQSGPLRIAAVRNGAGAANAVLEKPDDGFCGRIQDVRILNQALTGEQIDALSAELVPASLAGAVVCDFDFGKEINSTRAVDISKNRLEGQVVNLPERGVRGRYWDGTSIKWMDHPDQYDAITFYPDDLYDAQWKSDFSYVVPEDLPSGIYCARLRQKGFTEYVTFFVAAPKNQPRARLALWISDYSYVAYSNITVLALASKNYPGHNINDADTEFFKKHLNYGTGCVYNAHIDGRNFIYGSRLRPDLHMKPGAVVYNFIQDTHIAAFLEHHGIEFDIITDELVDAEGLELLQQYQCVISSTHHEYVPSKFMDYVSTFNENGGRFIYIGANGWFWSVDGHPELSGVVESRNFSDIADRYLTTGQRGGLMIETGNQIGTVFGVECSGMIFNGSSPYRKLEATKNPRAAWIFEGTGEGLVFGDYGIDKVHGAAAGFELDRFNPNNGAPRHALQLATSEPLRETIEDVKLLQLPLNIAYHPPKDPKPWAQADVVFFETANGGAMLSTGSINWISSALENNFDNDIAKITLNVVNRFLDPKPFPPIPETQVGDVDRNLDKPKYD